MLKIKNKSHKNKKNKSKKTKSKIKNKKPKNQKTQPRDIFLWLLLNMQKYLKK